MTSGQISTYFYNAKELIKANNPSGARAYLMPILNEVLASYKKASEEGNIKESLELSLFMDKWIPVVRDLRSKGITDYVLECFALKKKKEEKIIETPKEEKLDKTNKMNVDPDDVLPNEEEINQGWCAKIFEENKKAVVEIVIHYANKERNGTGFIISKNGYLLTNDHVVFDEETGNYCKNIKAKLNGSKKLFNVSVIFSDKSSDVALCSFDPEAIQDSFTSVKRIADYSKLMQGADCLIMGNAFGLGLAPFTGVVRFTKDDRGDLVYTAPSNPGDSGGPVFNRLGECIGMNKSKTLAVDGTEAEGYANATPMDKIDTLIARWAKFNHLNI